LNKATYDTAEPILSCIISERVSPLDVRTYIYNEACRICSRYTTISDHNESKCPA